MSNQATETPASNEADLNEAELKDVAGGATTITTAIKFDGKASLAKTAFSPETFKPTGFEPESF